MLTVALPNGSLRDSTIRLFAAAGIIIPDHSPRRHLIEVGHELVSRVVWLKPRDIPQVLWEGKIAQIGIVGTDCYREWYFQNYEKRFLLFVREFGYSKSLLRSTQVALIASVDEESSGPANGEKIITEFPFWASFLLPTAEIHGVAGSVEAFVGRTARFGVTLIETGESLRQNNLKTIRVLTESRPTIYVNRECEDLKSVARRLGQALFQAVVKLK